MEARKGSHAVSAYFSQHYSQDQRMVFVSFLKFVSVDKISAKSQMNMLFITFSSTSIFFGRSNWKSSQAGKFKERIRSHAS